MSNSVRIIFHALLWTGFLVLALNLQASFADTTDFKSLDANFLIVNLVLFYLHAYWLVPAYAERAQWRQYALLMLALTIGLSLLGAWVDTWSSTQTVLQQNQNLTVNLNGFLAGVWVKVLGVLPVSFAYKFLRDYLRDKRVSRFTEPGIHLLVWLIFVLPSATNWLAVPFGKQLLLFTGFTLTTIALFYLHVYWLIPAYLARRKFVQYGLSTVLLVMGLNALKAACIATSFYFDNIDFSWRNDFTHYLWRDTFSFYPLIVLVLSGIYRLTKDWLASESEKQQLLGEKLAAELAFLKYQINPHFLFNTLNNLYAMALTENSPRTADGVVKLSTLMRYVLYESDAPTVALDKEIAYLDEYVALQRLRVPDGIRIHFRVTGETAGWRVAPMLLVPFVENAFKHGISQHHPSVVDVQISVLGTELRMMVRNSVYPDKKAAQNEPGMGLTNVKRRLDMLYPGRHALTVDHQLDAYVVRLALTLT